MDSVWPRLFANSKRTDTKCRIWLGGTGRNRPYGRLHYRGKAEETHVVVWKLLRGPYDRKIWQLKSVCGNLTCFNPDHWELRLKNKARKAKIDGSKLCLLCGERKPTDDYYFNKNSGHFSTYCVKCTNNSPDLQKQRRASRLMATYGITYAEFESLLQSQDEKCAICHDPLTEETSNVDHCHTTNKVRGLLCRSCNTALGLFKDKTDFLDRASIYLQKAERSYACVHVVWRDAHQASGDNWFDELEDIKDRIVHTTGFIIPDAKSGHVVIIQSIDSVGNKDMALAIPVESVMSIKNVGLLVDPEELFS